MGEPNDDDDFTATTDAAEQEDRAFLEELIAGAESKDGDEPDTAGLDAPFDEDVHTKDAVDIVKGDEAYELARDVREGAPNKETASAEKKDSEEAGEGDADKADAEAKKADDPDAASKGDDGGDEGDADSGEDASGDDPGLGSKTFEELTEGMSDAQKTEVMTRYTQARAYETLFQANKDGLGDLGENPLEAAQRLVDLNNYAQKNPSEYVAWLAQQFGGEDPRTFIEGAAKHLGLELAPKTSADDDDDNLFGEEDGLTARERELMAENERLKAEREKPVEIGPDTTAAQNARAIQRLATEVDDAGNLKRPAWSDMEGAMARLARVHVQTTGQPVKPEDLAGFYDKAVAETAQRLGFSRADPAPAETSAAQGQDDVTERAKQAAKASEKARKASTPLDGTGQGASRRPALPEDASLRATLEHFMPEDS